MLVGDHPRVGRASGGPSGGQQFEQSGDCVPCVGGLLARRRGALLARKGVEMAGAVAPSALRRLSL